jgi:hypothetical protein
MPNYLTPSSYSKGYSMSSPLTSPTMSRISAPFDYSHSYTNLRDIEYLSPKQILNIDPTQIRSDIYNMYLDNHNSRLNKAQEGALIALMKIKKDLKEITNDVGTGGEKWTPDEITDWIEAQKDKYEENLERVYPTLYDVAPEKPQSSSWLSWGKTKSAGKRRRRGTRKMRHRRTYKRKGRKGRKHSKRM